MTTLFLYIFPNVEYEQRSIIGMALIGKVITEKRGRLDNKDPEYRDFAGSGFGKDLASGLSCHFK